MDSIALRTRFLLAETARLAQLHGRAAEAVTLVGVSKTHPAASVREAVGAGLRHVGESYVQEAVAKIEILRGLPVTWHFVGRLQANKTAAVATHFDWVHAIDRLRIAERLDAQRPAGKAPLQCCIEVNLSGEESKGGVSAEDLPALASAIAALPRLRLRGLMALPAPTDDPVQQRAPFAQLRGLLSSLRGEHPQLDTLSMGMSADMEAAIAEGATLVRIGTALFGPRAPRTATAGSETA
jgi:PLP dependent protein